MCSEIDSVNIDRMNLGFGECFEPTKTIEGPTFHEVIFSQGSYNGSWHFTRSAAPQIILSELMQKVRDVAHSSWRARPLGNGGSAEGKVEGKMIWGGKDGVKFSGQASGTVRDGKGNSVSAKVEQNSDGKGSATIAAKRENK